MTNYATDDEIASMWFHDNTVPGDNTISSTKNDLLKEMIQNYIKKKLGYKITDSDPDDDYGSYKRTFLYLYGRLLEDPTIILKETSEFGVIISSMLGMTSVGIDLTNSYYDVYNEEFSN